MYQPKYHIIYNLRHYSRIIHVTFISLLIIFSEKKALLSFQALPLVTVVVGNKIQGCQSVIFTTNTDVDKPRAATIDMPNKRSSVSLCKPGKPKWANYVKGMAFL